MRDMPRKELVAIIGQLADLGIMNRTTDGFGTLNLNSASWEVMRGTRKVSLPRSPAGIDDRESRSREVSWIGVDRGLFDELRALRKELADDRGVPPFVIFGDASLRDMARRRPRTAKAFQLMHGVGAAKADEFGEQFIAKIDRYCAAKNLSENLDAAPVAPMNRPSKRPTEAALRARAMFANGATVDQVAEAAGRARSTVFTYLMNYIEEEKPASIEPWVSDAMYTRIAAAAGTLGGMRLKPIFEAMNGSASYDEIRLVTTHLNAIGAIDPPAA